MCIHVHTTQEKGVYILYMYTDITSISSKKNNYTCTQYQRERSVHIIHVHTCTQIFIQCTLILVQCTQILHQYHQRKIIIHVHVLYTLIYVHLIVYTCIQYPRERSVHIHVHIYLYIVQRHLHQYPLTQRYM